MVLWWCTYYNRPLKDPILQEYTVEELVYEYHLLKNQKDHKRELDELEDDKIKEAKLQADEDWANQMEREEAEEEARQAAAEVDKKEQQQKEAYDPLKDPKNIEWMEEKMKEAKTFFDDDSFGEDLNLSFDDFDGDT